MSGQMKSPALLTAEKVVAGKKTSLSLLRLMVGQHHFFLLCLLILLLIGDFLCYQQALPLEVDAQAGKVTLKVGSQSLALGEIGTPVLIELPAQNPVIHEYQMDGTDNTNNFTLDPDYFARIASTPYYRFQAWMRNLDGTSRWSDLHVYADSKQLESIDWPKNGSQVNWPAQNAASNLRLQIALRRPEIPMTLRIVTSKQQTIKITLDRNNRTIQVIQLTSQFEDQGKTLASTFFPIDILPFAAMVADTLLRVLIWAIIALLFVAAGETLLNLFFTVSYAQVFLKIGEKIANFFSYFQKKLNITNSTLHPLALLALLISFGFVSWISAVQYNGEPHIYDASAYLFAAKMYATGHLAVPVPSAIDRFPGPFMLNYQGQWFGQYAPGTALTLVPGIWLGVPWLVEPLLGTLSLLGIGLLAARFYDRRVATLAVILGTLSPFYSYLAASYLSHAIALFYLVWGTLLFVRFLQKAAWWNLPLSALCFGMAGLTRDQVTMLFVVTTLGGISLLSYSFKSAHIPQNSDNTSFPESLLKPSHFSQNSGKFPFSQKFLKLREKIWKIFSLNFKNFCSNLWDEGTDWQRWVKPGACFLAIIAAFMGLTLLFNAYLTGNAAISPRLLFFAGDRWGFGHGIGFYGQHTIAAGLVNLDEQLTILLIDLYGWPFYLTLALLAIPFLTRKALKWDWLFLALATLLTAAYIGYFYHGIYLGPRYLFETLPFLLILTARGILTLAAFGNDVKAWLRSSEDKASPQTEQPYTYTWRSLVVAPKHPYRGHGDEAIPTQNAPDPSPTYGDDASLSLTSTLSANNDDQPIYRRGALHSPTGTPRPPAARPLQAPAGIRPIGRSWPTILLMLALISCNLLYFLPRQIQLHDNFSGLPYNAHIQLKQIYHPNFHHAIIVTNDYTIYQFVLFPLNDPQLQGDVLYAYASNQEDYAQLRKAYPGRELLQLQIDSDGTVHYVEMNN